MKGWPGIEECWWYQQAGRSAGQGSVSTRGNTRPVSGTGSELVVRHAGVEISSEDGRGEDSGMISIIFTREIIDTELGLNMLSTIRFLEKFLKDQFCAFL